MLVAEVEVRSLAPELALAEQLFDAKPEAPAVAQRGDQLVGRVADPAPELL